jgi:alpha-1,2-rhamnosyltransferase
MPRIFLECSQTAADSRGRGIHRVVRNLILYHAGAARELAIEAAPAQLSGRRFYPFAWRPGRDASGAGPARGRKRPRLRKVRRAARSIWLRTMGTPLRPRAGDLMVLADASWGLPIWAAVADWRRHGGKIAFVIYDILPLTNPEFVPPRWFRSFSDWFARVCEHADLLLAISDTVRDQLRELLERRGSARPQGPPRVESFRLGAELDMRWADAGVQPAVRAACAPSSGPRPYLMVGAIEPRKNHHRVLDAFELLWKQGSRARLIVVGRRGFGCDEIERRFLDHPRLGQDLFWFPELSDTELEHCYRSAKAVVFASLGEGYGLPIAEGLQHGLPVIASDLPAHREVAGEFAAYFDPAQPEALAARIEQLETLGELPGVLPAKNFRAFTWYEGTMDLLQRCRDFAQGLPG